MIIIPPAVGSEKIDVVAAGAKALHAGSPDEQKTRRAGVMGRAVRRSYVPAPIARGSSIAGRHPSRRVQRGHGSDSARASEHHCGQSQPNTPAVSSEYASPSRLNMRVDLQERPNQIAYCQSPYTYPANATVPVTRNTVR
jgi:hypothetical protein